MTGRDIIPLTPSHSQAEELVERCAKALFNKYWEHAPGGAINDLSLQPEYIRADWQDLARACLAAREAFHDEKNDALALVIIEKGVERGYLTREEADRKREFFLRGFKSHPGKARPVDEGNTASSPSTDAQRIEQAIKATNSDPFSGGHKP